MLHVRLYFLERGELVGQDQGLRYTGSHGTLSLATSRAQRQHVRQHYANTRAVPVRRAHRKRRQEWVEVAHGAVANG